MRRILSLIVLATAVTAAAVAVFVLASLPPAAQRPAPAGGRDMIAVGAWHVHSSRSDGSGSIEDIAAAAHDAGLDFVVLTDHGDATRPFDPPRYLHDVLIIDAAEINTESGHVVALDLQRPSDYPIAGELRDVVEDIHRLGGWVVAAHPDSPRPNLRWRGQPADVDAVEWLNVDAEWRSHGAASIAAAAIRSAVRGPEAIASMFRAPAPGLARWDAMQRGRPVAGLAAVDAHARLGADDASWGSAASLRFPSYAVLFRTVAQAVPLPERRTGAPEKDARAVVSGLRSGRSYSIVRAFVDASPALEFSAATAVADRVGIGGHVPAGVAGKVIAEIQGVPSTRVDLLRDGRVVKSGQGRVEFDAPGMPANYRVEAYVPGHRLPWLVSNSIYFDREEPAPLAGNSGPRSQTQELRVPPDSWQIEASATSRASVDAAPPGGVVLTYRLGGGAAAGQYVALATAASGESALDRIAITAASETPMRVSLQVRVPGGRDGRRWRKSLYLDREPRTYVVSLAELEPVERGSALRPIVARVQSVLLVIDTVNAVPGSSGVVRITDARLITVPASASAGQVRTVNTR
jgi:hypothetical protein